MQRIDEQLDDGARILTNSRRAVGAAERLQRQTRELLVRYRLHALRLVRGGSDVDDDDRQAHGESAAPDKAALLTKLLLETPPLCVACISTKSGLLVGDIEPVASRLEQTIFVKREMGSCRNCDRWTLVYSLFGTPRSR